MKKNNTNELKLGFLGRTRLGMRTKLTTIFLMVKILPIILLAIIAVSQVTLLGETLQKIAVEDSSAALNASAVNNIERMTTDTAKDVANFLYSRDDDIRYLSKLVDTSNIAQTEKSFKLFSENNTRKIVKRGEWKEAEDGKSWVRTDKPKNPEQNVSGNGGVSQNPENEVDDGWHYRDPDFFEYEKMYLYDEISFIGLDGIEKVKVTAGSLSNKDIYGENVLAGKSEYNDNLNNLLAKNTYGNYKNTFVQGEAYPAFLTDIDGNYLETDVKIRNKKGVTEKTGGEKLHDIGDVYVSDVVGAYKGSNHIGMYTESIVANSAVDRGYDIDYTPTEQAYSGAENPTGKRFEGIVRWVTPVYENGVKTGYVSFALNHDHIMEFVDHITPMNERYTETPSAYEGNYAFIWDYNCRSICHPRHHSITGFNEVTGEREIPWLETTDYNTFLESEYADNWDNDLPYWNKRTEDNSKDLPSLWNYLNDKKSFDGQSRNRKPTTQLTRLGYVGLDGRYLNTAPQCIGWMDMTVDGGSGSFYILWSGIPKFNTAGAIPYYTGQYGPTELNGGSYRGFGFVAIGAGVDDFTKPADNTEIKLTAAIDDGLKSSIVTLIWVIVVIILIVIVIAFWIATSITGSIKALVGGMSRFRSGQRQFRFNTQRRDEFGQLADSFDEMADGIVDSVKHPLSITDMNRRVIYMNDEGLELCRMTLDEIVGSLYSESSIYPANSKYCPITAFEEGKEAEVYFDEASGHYLQGSASYLMGKDGEKRGYIIESRDMTDIVLRQEQLQQQKTLLDQIFAGSPDLIWYKDADGKYLTVNPRYAAILGIPEDDFTGKLSSEIMSKDLESFSNHDTSALNAKKPIYTEEKIKFADGHEETLESVRTPIINDADEVVGLLGFSRNVSARVRIEQQLRKTQSELVNAVELANNASKHKGDFLARMSHEIRTPMNAIIGITNIVLSKLTTLDNENKDVKEINAHLNQIQTSSQHLLGLLNDVLDISKIEAGKIELADEVVDITKLVATVNGIIKPRCDEKNINYKIVTNDFSHNVFLCDSLRLRQVLINLLGNAVKFTPECGVIELSVLEKKSKKDSVLFEFSVQDSGIGISKESLVNIFEAFEQAEGNISKKYGGTGLGLAISQKIINLFGGEIKVESEVGEGSKFYFSIWLKKTDEETIDDVEISNIENKFIGKRLLLVDDVEINRVIVKAILEGTGVEIDEADDGIVAVDAFKKSPEFYYDLVLMDIKMPNMDGYEASSTIRSLERTDANTVPIVALTANAFKDDIDQATQHGMNAHVSKPVESANLLEVLIRFLIKE